nr:radical SAM family heme chaperone HemW [Dermatophilus congolensis]
MTVPSLPLGDPAPADGALPPAAVAALQGPEPFGYYVHVPFCYRRCGYCDFNTYVPSAGVDGQEQMRRYVAAAATEIDLSARVLAGPDKALRPVDTVFFGGGTPTMLAAEDIVTLLDTIRSRFGLIDGAEVTVEANPDTTSAESLARLADSGVTRISVGMQSAVGHVLETLDRTHTPDNVEATITAAKDAGLVTSLDLIYGTPGESLADWQVSLHAAIALEPDHISAYGLVIEEGTAMGEALRRGAVAPTDDDDEAAKYEMADRVLAAAGYRWYEVSNWARNEVGRGRHNEGYWHDGHWWGVGPGAHSHIGGVRWWNVKYPAAYAAALEEGRSPAAAREVLDEEARVTEKIMLGIRLAEGLPLSVLDSGFTAGPQVARQLSQEGLLRGDALADAEPRAVLTDRGRLLADLVLRRMLGY